MLYWRIQSDRRELHGTQLHQETHPGAADVIRALKDRKPQRPTAWEVLTRATEGLRSCTMASQEDILLAISNSAGWRGTTYRTSPRMIQGRCSLSIEWAGFLCVW